MATIPIQSIRPPDFALARPGSEDGDQYQNDGRVALQIENRGSVDVTVTLLAARQPGFPLTCPDQVVTLGAGSFTEFPKYPPQWFSGPNSFVQIRYSPTTEAPNLFVSAVRNADER